MTQPSLKSDGPVKPKDASGLFAKRKTYFGFLPVWNEGRHNMRLGGLAQDQQTWRVKTNQEVYDALADLHHPVVALPSGRFEARAALRKLHVEVKEISEWQLNELVRRHGSNPEALASGLLSCITASIEGDVLWV